MTKIHIDGLSVHSELQIFILEDEPFFQKKMMATLGDIGFNGNFILVSSVTEAKAKIQTVKPDIILSDWNLPDGIGLEFLKLVRADARFDKVPCLMVTTMDNIDNILSAINAGADGYIVKPWEEAEVIEKLAFALEKRTEIP